MTLVVDASVVLKWVVAEPGSAAALGIYRAHRAGAEQIATPGLLRLELLNVVARKLAWAPDDVLALAEEHASWRLEVAEPGLARVAAWTTRGLSAYDACYVALAEELGCELVTADAEILGAAPELARPLGT